MAEEELVGSGIEAGRRLVEALERAGLPIAVATWLKRQDEDTRFLYIATPDVEKHGPIAVYKLIDKIIDVLDEPRITVDDVVAANTTNHFVNVLSSAISLKATGLRLVNVNIHGVPIQDAYVYKIQREVKASRKPIRATSDVKKKAIAVG